MKLQAFYTIVACLVFFTSCRDNESRDNKDTLNTEENEFSPVDRNIPREDVEEEEIKDGTGTTTENNSNTPGREVNNKETDSENSRTALTGQFIKKGQENDTNCGCYCLDLTSDTTELCLIEGKMYVNTRLQKNSNNTVDIFLVEPSARNTEGKDIPWKNFDRNSAIATIKPSGNGELELDWLGFKINGDLAVDYAIFGKKTLEGQYQKK